VVFSTSSGAVNVSDQQDGFCMSPRTAVIPHARVSHSTFRFSRGQEIIYDQIVVAIGGISAP
jgi:hypothetical protein